MNNFYLFSCPKWIGTRPQALFLTAVMLLFSMGIAHAQRAVQLADQVNNESSVFSTSPTYNAPAQGGVPLTTFVEGCDQETPSNDFENGLGNLHLLIFANDYTVSPGETFTLNSLDFNVLVEPGMAVNNADIHFYEDSGSGPGEEMTEEAVTALVPSSSEDMGEAFDFDVVKVTFELDDPVVFTGSGTATSYYVGVQIDYDGESSYMEATTIVNTSQELYYYDSDTETWIASSDPESDNGFGEAYDGVISFYGECTTLDVCTGQPEAGEIEGDASFDLCPNIGFSLTVTDAEIEGSGFTVNWQSKDSEADEDAWTDIEGESALILNVPEGITQDTDYRFYAECDDSGLSDTTEPVSISISPANECYCTPIYSTGCSSNDRISNVSLTGESESLDNDSECSDNDYGDYTDLTPADLAPGETYTLNVSTDYTSPTYEQVRAWIDYNQDGQFTDDEEIANTNGAGLIDGTQNFDFTVTEGLDADEYRMRVRLVYSASDSDFDPCGSQTYGETEDYTVEIIQLDDCEGTPIAGTVDDDFSVCAGNAFSISVSGASDPANGLERIWQSSPTGEDDWTDIEGESANTYTASEGIEEVTDFRYKVTCINSEETDISEVVIITLNPSQECYCIPENNASSTSYISNFSTSNALQDLNNSSDFSDNGYGDYIDDQSLVVFPGQEIDFTTTFAGGTSYVEVWIDYNQNGNFDDEGEHVVSSGSYVSSSYSESVTISSDFGGGITTRMRVRVQNLGGAPGACEESGYGETEDYTIEINELEDCSGTPSAGTIDDDFSVCAGNAFTLTASDASDPVIDLDRIWQSSPAGEDNWTDIDGANQNTYTAENGIEDPMDFRYKVTCTNSDETDISDIVTVSLNPGTECYCTPIYSNACSSNDLISNVSLTGESETLNNDSECSAENYGDYTDLTPPDLAPGETYTLSVSTIYTTPTSEQVRAWIDYNGDGQFTDEEEIANTNGDGLIDGSESFEFTVTEGATSGEYRMRVRLVYGSSVPTFDACSDESYGETEDYTVEIIQLEDCDGTPVAGTVEDDFSVCAGDPFNITVTGASDPANGLHRIWQSSTAGEDDWTDIEGAASNTYLVSNGITEPTDFRYKVTCDNSEESVFSNVVTVTLNPAEECYCIPEGAADNGDSIVNFTLADLNNDSESGTSTNASGYSDYSDTVDPVELVPGESYTASLTAGPGSGTHGAAIWIDYNADGFFDSTEKVTKVGILIAAGETVSFPEFTVPDSPGMHRLRVQYVNDVHGGDLDPCVITTSNSETEDYMVNIVGDNCEAPSGVSVEIENTTAVVDWTENGSATEWELIYGAPGFDPETEGESMTVQEKPVTLSDLEPETDYEVYIIAICAEDNLSDLSEVKAFTTGELSLKNQVFENFTYYPNPVKDQLMLKAGMQIEKLNVYNLLGQKVLSSKPNTVEAQLNTDRLPSGIYLMKVTLDGNTKIFRLIKR